MPRHRYYSTGSHADIMLPSILALGLVAIVSVRLAITRISNPSHETARISASTALGVMVLIQIVHFLEELATGFHKLFGPVFGQPPMPVSIFVIVNVALIGLWLYSIRGLRQGTILAFAASWFLGLAGVLNGVAHPLLALTQGGYFPGLYSSGIVFIAGGYLLSKLVKATVRSAYSV